MESIIKLKKVDSFKMMEQDAGNGIDNYQISDEIGSGAYGKVYHAMDKHTGRHVAIKKIVSIELRPLSL